MALTYARFGVARFGATRFGYLGRGAKMPLKAVSGVARFGGTRFNYLGGELALSVNGVEVGANAADPTAFADRQGATIQDNLLGTTNTMIFTCQGFTPQFGQAVDARIGTVHNLASEFRGRIAAIQQVMVGPRLVQSVVTATDPTRELNRRKVWARFTATSASAIAASLLSSYATGFTATHVEANLPVVDEITFTAEELTSCLDRLAARIGGYWFCDATGDLWFFTTYPSAAQTSAPLNFSNPVIESLAFTRDLSQMVSRVIFEGGGARVPCAVAAGETILPVEDTSWYSATGGKVAVGPQRVTYAGVQAGGGGGLVGPGAAPSAAPAAACVSGSGVETGSHDYAVTFTTAGGESLAGPRTTVVVGLMSAPATAPTPSAPASGNGPDPGSHTYAVSFVTAGGETIPGAISDPVTIGELVAKPSSAPTPGTPSPVTTGNLAAGGGYRYKVTYVTAVGETEPCDSYGGFSGVDVAGAGLTVSAGTPSASPGAVDAGVHGYDWTAVTASGETVGKGSFNVNLAAASTVPLTISVSSDPRVTQVRIYRTTAAGATYKLLATVAHGTTSYTDSTPDASLSATTIPVSDTASTGKIQVTGIPTGPTGVTARRLYRTAISNATPYKLVSTISDNTTTSYLDNVADGSRGADAPTANTTAYRKVTLSAIPLGDGTVTARKIWRTYANGATRTFYLLTTIADNTTTTYVDQSPDASLGAAAPSVTTAPANQVELTALPIGGTSVTGRKVYRTAAGGSTLKLLATIGDNTTATYTDTTADASLGADAPGSDTSGLAQPSGQAIAGSTSLVVSGISSFSASGGWAIVGNGQQLVRYTGKSDTALTGIPASGAGAIVASIGYNSNITASPALTGIPASGAGAILYAITEGEQANLLVEVTDATAVATIAAADGSDGIVEDYQRDNRLSALEATARATARLALLASIDVEGNYTTRDLNARSGQLVPMTFGPPVNLVANVRLQSVTVSDFSPTLPPLRTVRASSRRYTYEDLLRQAARQGATS